MAIHDRFGFTVQILRLATPEDVLKLERRKKLDKQDREYLKQGSYLVTKDVASPNGKPMEDPESLNLIFFLRADGGLKEIQETIEALSAAKPG